MSIENLPYEKRSYTLKLLSVCNRIAEAAQTGRRGAQKTAVSIAARELQISETSMYRHYSNFIKSGKNPESLIDRRHGEQGTRSRVTSAEFITFWQALCTKYQRNGSVPSARRELVKIWQTQSQVIPGYEDWAGWPKIPTGWSLKNLQRHAPGALDKTLLKQGIRAATPMLAQVMSTREGCWPGSHVMFDDVQLDLIIHDGKDAGRPLQLGANDYYTGRRLCWGQKIRREDEETKKKIYLNQQDMRCILAMWGANFGYSARGTTLVVERGTANIPVEIEELLYNASNGLIKVDRSGILGRNQLLKGGFNGRNTGNPRHKAALESWHNLLHNIISDLKAQIGHNRNEPETHFGLMRAEQKLMRAIEENPEIADIARRYTCSMRELVEYLFTRIAEVNNRWDHNLEGWARCGFETEEMRMSPTANWEPSSKILPAIANQLLITAAETGLQLVRRRKMSPTEAWDYSTSLPGNELIPLPDWCICDILGRDLARKITVQSAYIKLQDKSLSDELMYFGSEIRTKSGRMAELPYGTYQAFANPYDPKKLFICDEIGKFIGVSQIVRRVSAADEQAVKHSMGEKAARRQRQQEHARMLGAERELEITRDREFNKRLIAGQPVTALEYAQQALSMASPQDKREMTKLAKDSQIDIWAGEGEMDEDADFGNDDAPRISIF